MGREQLRVMVCAAASVALIVAGTLFMEWYRLSLGQIVANLPMKATIDLRNAQICPVGVAVCTTVPLKMLDGFYSSMAAATMWSSLGFAALIALQGVTHLVTGNASESVTRLGYVFGVLTLATAIATAYVFGPDPSDPGFARLAQAGGTLHRTWGAAAVIGGLVAGFLALYATGLEAPSEPAPAYRLRPTMASSNLPVARMTSGPLAPTSSGAPRMQSGPFVPNDAPPRTRRPSSIPLNVEPRSTAPLPTAGRGATTAPPPMARTSGPISPMGGTSGPIAPPMRNRTASIPAIPDHLRNRLAYVAITTELTGGGLDARREDGSSRLVLWRDVVGAVVRRLPEVYSSSVFIDIVSTAGSTVRIVPWTRLSGDRIAEDADGRPRALVEYILLKAPGAKLDAATRQFLDTGEIAQLPDLETLQAHDARLA